MPPMMNRMVLPTNFTPLLATVALMSCFFLWNNPVMVSSFVLPMIPRSISTTTRRRIQLSRYQGSVHGRRRRLRRELSLLMTASTMDCRNSSSAVVSTEARKIDSDTLYRNDTDAGISSADPAADGSSTTAAVSLLDLLTSWFQGDFDNYRQVVDDRRASLLPREGGGHEHIHCSLIPVTATSRLAAFYFDGNPSALFRLRFYRLQPSSVTATPTFPSPSTVVDAAVDNDGDDDCVDTLLYTLDTKLELKLRSCSDLLQWPDIFTRHVQEQTQLINNNNSVGSAATAADDADTSVGGGGGGGSGDTSADSNDVALMAVHSGYVSLLPKCEVRWSWTADPIQHSYIVDRYPSTHDVETTVPDDLDGGVASWKSQHGVHAVMVHGQALIDSQMMPGQQILIRDQLSLWSHALWIHDRGFNPDTMAYIYGNQRDVPYRLQRVASLAHQWALPVVVATATPADDSTTPLVGQVSASASTVAYSNVDERIVVTDPDLAWTLGPMYRSPIEYERNMKRIGGKSTRA